MSKTSKTANMDEICAMVDVKARADLNACVALANTVGRGLEVLEKQCFLHDEDGNYLTPEMVQVIELLRQSVDKIDDSLDQIAMAEELARGLGLANPDFDQCEKDKCVKDFGEHKAHLVLMLCEFATRVRNAAIEGRQLFEFEDEINYMERRLQRFMGQDKWDRQVEEVQRAKAVQQAKPVHHKPERGSLDDFLNVIKH